MSHTTPSAAAQGRPPDGPPGRSRDAAVRTGPDELLRLLLDNDTLHRFLAGLATAAAADVTGKLSCGVTVRPVPRQPFTFGSSDAFALQLDQIQYDVGDGPCLHSLRSGETVEVDDTTHEPRWHAYMTRAAAEGARASLSVPMVVAGQHVPVGALNLYAHHPRDFDPSDRRAATGFAAQAAGAVAIAIRLAERAARAEHLRVALGSRYLIDQAIGVVMAGQHCTAATAFDRLAALSQRTNRKLRDIAADLVRDVSGHDPEPPPDGAGAPW